MKEWDEKLKHIPLSVKAQTSDYLVKTLLESKDQSFVKIELHLNHYNYYQLMHSSSRESDIKDIYAKKITNEQGIKDKIDPVLIDIIN